MNDGWRRDDASAHHGVMRARVTRRRLLAVLAVLAVVAVVVAWAAARRPPRQELVVVDPACPPLVSGTSDAADDYGDTVEWSGRTWWRTEGRTTADTHLASGVVICSIAEIPNAKGWRVAQQDWADGVATVLPRGTRLYSPREDRAGSALVAATPQGDVLYCPDAPDSC